MMNRLKFRNRVLRFLPFLADLNEARILAQSYYNWKRAGLPVPAPHPIKRALLMREAKRLQADIFVETGTFTGDTVWFMRDGFRKIFSIEVQPELAKLASERFDGHNHISIVEGDSSTILSTLGSNIDGTTLYWLDGHYSAGVTGRGAKDCPIFEELDAIAAHKPGKFSIAIDDFRCFGADPAYPTSESLFARIKALFPNLTITTELDIVWCRG